MASQSVEERTVVSYGQSEARHKSPRTNTPDTIHMQCQTKATLYSAPSVISAVKSFRILSSSKPSSFPNVRPFSFAKCRRQMKQYDVEISAMACLGYTCCRLFMTEVKRREPSSAFSDGGGA